MNSNSKQRFKILLFGCLMVAGVVWFVTGVPAILRPDPSPQVYQKEGPVEPRDVLQEFEYHQVHMAMPVTLTVWAKNRQSAETACKAAFARITELEAVFSDYSNTSETGRFNKLLIGETISVSDEFIELLDFSKKLCQITEGIFDPTMGLTVRLWRRARQENRLPSTTEVTRALESGGFETLHWGRASEASSDGQANRPDHWQLTRNGVSSLDFGAVAKGYIGDQVLLTLDRHGIQSARFEAGGDIVCSAAPPGTEGWEVELPKLGRRFVQNVGVAVSGDTIQFVEVNGQRYSHVIDLRTGRGVSTRRMAVVIAPSGALSDTLATTGCVMDEAEFQKLITRFANVEAFNFVVDDE